MEVSDHVVSKHTGEAPKIDFWFTLLCLSLDTTSNRLLIEAAENT